MNALTLTLFCYILLEVSVTPSKGEIGGSLERCTCRGQVPKAVRKKLIQTVQVLPPGAFCSKTEILLTLRRNKKVCLDPKGRQGKRIIRLQSAKTQGKKQNPKKRNQREQS